MNFEQRIERMEAVLVDVMLNIDLNTKKESLQLIKDNLFRIKDVNFRFLINITLTRINKNVSD